MHANSPLVITFQSWAWLYSWWEHYDEEHKLRLITVPGVRLLVGVAPLMIERRAGLPGDSCSSAPA